MSRWSFNAMLFFVGLGLAAIVVYAINVPFAGDLTSARGAFSAAERPGDAARKTDAGRDQVVVHLADDTITGTTVDFERLRAELSRGAGLAQLEGALDSDRLEELQLVSTEFVETIPGYQNTFNPLLRKWALDRVVTRLEPSDWQNWPDASRARNGQPSNVRRYIDQIQRVNGPLGGYLETAVWLFYDLYTTTQRGEAYDAQAGLRKVLRNAEDSALRSARNRRLAPILAPLILLDPAFSAQLEIQRCRLVSEYLAETSLAVKRELKLISSLNAQYCDPDAYGRVAETLQILAKSSDDRLRLEFLKVESELRTMEVFARGDDRVRTALAELYAISAVALLELGDRTIARRYLVESIGLKPGLRSQTFLQEFFRQTSEEPVKSTRRELSFERAPAVEAAQREESTSFVFSSLVMIMVGAPLFLLMRRLYSTVPQVNPAIRAVPPKIQSPPKEVSPKPVPRLAVVDNPVVDTLVVDTPEYNQGEQEARPRKVHNLNS